MDENDNKTWLTEDIWCNMDPHTADFAYEQGEKYFKQLEEVAKAITNRCYWLLGLFSTICPLLIASYFVIEDEWIAFISFLFICLCLVLSIYILKAILPQEGYLSGRPPKSMLLQCDWENEKRMVRRLNIMN